MPLVENLRNLLNSNPFKENYEKNRLRPPGAVSEKLFMERCIRCGRCISVCPYRCLERASGGISVGTPYIYADKKACVMCMLCASVCPTGALDSKVTEPEDTRIGLAVIDEERCLNFKYAKDEELGRSEGALYCNTCYNVCPFREKALYLQDLILPTVTDKCTGCGLCVERCPTSPKSVEIVPSGMGDAATAGFYYRRRRRSRGFDGEKEMPKGEEYLREKEELSGDEKFEFKYDFNTETRPEGW